MNPQFSQIIKAFNIDYKKLFSTEHSKYCSLSMLFVISNIIKSSLKNRQ